MLAPPPPLDIEFDVALRGRYRGRRSPATTEDDDESWQSSSPSSPDDSVRTTSWKRKRVGMNAWCDAVESSQLTALQLQRSRSEQELSAATAELEAVQQKLKEAQVRMAQMACALASTATHECGLCHNPISGSAVGSGCMCHFCHDCLLDAVANGACACCQCGAPIKEVKPDAEFDALLKSTATLSVGDEESALLDAAVHALVGPPGRIVAADAVQAPETIFSLAKGTARKDAAPSHSPSKAAPAHKVTFAWPVFVRSFSFGKKR